MKKTKTEEYIERLQDDEKILIINGYEKLCEDGFIGDEPIRLHAVAFIQELGYKGENIVWWMEQLAFQCFRYFALLEINSRD